MTGVTPDMLSDDCYIVLREEDKGLADDRYPRVFLGRNIEQRRSQKLGNPTCLANSRTLVCEDTLLRRKCVP